MFSEIYHPRTEYIAYFVKARELLVSNSAKFLPESKFKTQINKVSKINTQIGEASHLNTYSGRVSKLNT